MLPIEVLHMIPGLYLSALHKVTLRTLHYGDDSSDSQIKLRFARYKWRSAVEDYAMHLLPFAASAISRDAKPIRFNLSRRGLDLLTTFFSYL
jgi:hypothetical protein